ncbi:MAG: hypothetical protein NTX03_00990 [Bacteroidetes bacterium]|nr:hypothetical protein [Bacteroidota bacterium]
MPKAILLIVLILFSPLWASSQDVKDSTRKQIDYRYNLSFYPFALIEPDNGLRFSLEIPIIENFTILPDYNYIFSGESLFPLFADKDYKSNTGYSARLGLRYYVLSSKTKRLYFSMEGQMKEVRMEYNKPINDYKNYNPDYKMAYAIEKVHLRTINFKAGLQTTFETNFNLECYMGLGFRLTSRNYEYLDHTSPPNVWSDEIDFNNGQFPNFLFGFSIGYFFGDSRELNPLFFISQFKKK